MPVRNEITAGSCGNSMKLFRQPAMDYNKQRRLLTLDLGIFFTSSASLKQRVHAVLRKALTCTVSPSMLPFHLTQYDVSVCFVHFIALTSVILPPALLCSYLCFPTLLLNTPLCNTHTEQKPSRTG